MRSPRNTQQTPEKHFLFARGVVSRSIPRWLLHRAPLLSPGFGEWNFFNMKYLRLIFLIVFAPLALLAQSTPVGGLITNHTTWSPAMGTILVYSNVVVTNTGILTIQAGTTVKLTNNVSITGMALCMIDVE